MDSSPGRRAGIIMLAAAAAVTTWGIAGFITNLELGRGGFVYSPEYVVEGVEPGGAAESAGMRAGDRVIAVGTIRVERLPLYSRWPRSLTPKVGETLRIIVERDGERLPLDIVYGATPPGVVRLRIGAGFVGLSFLWCGIWALLVVRTEHALALARIGLAAGVATCAGPYLGTWDGAASHVNAAAMILFCLWLLRFFLLFPEEKRPGRSRFLTGLLYGSWAVCLGLMVLELVYHPVLYHAFGGPFSLLMLIFCLLAGIAFVHTVARTPAAQKRKSGVNLVLAGIVAAVVPALVGVVDWAFLRSFEIPGSAYFPLLLAALPLSMAMAVRRQASHELRNGNLSFLR